MEAERLSGSGTIEWCAALVFVVAASIIARHRIAAVAPHGPDDWHAPE
jgi:hypothetical protein